MDAYRDEPTMIRAKQGIDATGYGPITYEYFYDVTNEIIIINTRQSGINTSRSLTAVYDSGANTLTATEVGDVETTTFTVDTTTDMMNVSVDDSNGNISSDDFTTMSYPVWLERLSYQYDDASQVLIIIYSDEYVQQYGIFQGVTSDDGVTFTAESDQYDTSLFTFSFTVASGAGTLTRTIGDSTSSYDITGEKLDLSAIQPLIGKNTRFFFDLSQPLLHPKLILEEYAVNLEHVNTIEIEGTWDQEFWFTLETNEVGTMTFVLSEFLRDRASLQVRITDANNVAHTYDSIARNLLSADSWPAPLDADTYEFDTTNECVYNVALLPTGLIVREKYDVTYDSVANTMEYIHLEDNGNTRTYTLDTTTGLGQVVITDIDGTTIDVGDIEAREFTSFSEGAYTEVNYQYDLVNEVFYVITDNSGYKSTEIVSGTVDSVAGTMTGQYTSGNSTIDLSLVAAAPDTLDIDDSVNGASTYTGIYPIQAHFNNYVIRHDSQTGYISVYYNDGNETDQWSIVQGTSDGNGGWSYSWTSYFGYDQTLTISDGVV